MKMLLVSLVGASLSVVAAAAEPAEPMPTLEIELRLLGALAGPPPAEGQPAGPAASLVMDLSRTAEGWQRVWAINSEDRKPLPINGRVADAEVGEQRIALDLQMRLSGVSPLRIELKRSGDQLSGTYRLTRDGRTVEGRADGRIKPRRPALPAGFKPVEPGERPRILFRRSDLPALREKMKTPLGKAAFDAMGRDYDAIGAGVKYQLTGDRKFAEQAMEFAAAHIAGKGPKYSHRTAWGRHPEQVAIAYDLCRDAWPAEFVRKVEAYLLETGNTYVDCAVASGGMNWHVCSNWSAKVFCGAGFIGLALWGEKGPAPARPEGPDAEALLPFWQDEMALWKRSGGLNMDSQRIFERSRYYMYLHNREGAGTGGFKGECAHYGMKASEMAVEYAACFRGMFGFDVSPYPDMTLVVPRQMFGHVYPADAEGNPDKPRPLTINGWTQIWGNYFTYGYPIAPQAWQPALLWAWNRQLGADGPDAIARRIAEKGWSDDLGEPAWFFVSYPLDTKPQPPAGLMPLTWQAPDMGYYGFRNRWRDGDDVVLQVYAKATQNGGWNGPNAGTFHLYGLGHSWNHDSKDREIIEHEVNRVVLPETETNAGALGRVVHVATQPDGSGTLSIDLSDAYGKPVRGLYSKYGNIRHDALFEDAGIKALRAMAIDTSGASGAPCLFVLVDRIEGGGPKLWTWNLGDARLIEAVKVDGGSLTLTQGDAILRGRFVSPAGAKVEAKVNPVKMTGRKGEQVRPIPSILATGGDLFFFVATLGAAADKAPEVTVRGSGADAVVTVGQRTIRFDGTKILLGTP